MSKWILAVFGIKSAEPKENASEGSPLTVNDEGEQTPDTPKPYGDVGQVSKTTPVEFDRKKTPSGVKKSQCSMCKNFLASQKTCSKPPSQYSPANAVKKFFNRPPDCPNFDVQTSEGGIFPTQHHEPSAIGQPLTTQKSGPVVLPSIEDVRKSGADLSLGVKKDYRASPYDPYYDYSDLLIDSLRTEIETIKKATIYPNKVMAIKKAIANSFNLFSELKDYSRNDVFDNRIPTIINELGFIMDEAQQWIAQYEQQKPQPATPNKGPAPVFKKEEKPAQKAKPTTEKTDEVKVVKDFKDLQQQWKRKESLNIIAALEPNAFDKVREIFVSQLLSQGIKSITIDVSGKQVPVKIVSFPAAAKDLFEYVKSQILSARGEAAGPIFAFMERVGKTSSRVEDLFSETALRVIERYHNKLASEPIVREEDKPEIEDPTAEEQLVENDKIKEKNIVTQQEKETQTVVLTPEEKAKFIYLFDHDRGALGKIASTLTSLSGYIMGVAANYLRSTWRSKGEQMEEKKVPTDSKTPEGETKQTTWESQMSRHQPTIGVGSKPTDPQDKAESSVDKLVRSTYNKLLSKFENYVYSLPDRESYPFVTLDAYKDGSRRPKIEKNMKDAGDLDIESYINRAFSTANSKFNLRDTIKKHMKRFLDKELASNTDIMRYLNSTEAKQYLGYSGNAAVNVDEMKSYWSKKLLMDFAPEMFYTTVNGSMQYITNSYSKIKAYLSVFNTNDRVKYLVAMINATEETPVNPLDTVVSPRALLELDTILETRSKNIEELTLPEIEEIVSDLDKLEVK